ncbi:MAG: hypothetical protein IT499_17140 [Rubrivivax sp.]|nr:hypothetical protein [Rubrivivax sp.]MCL4695733.1 hypothetical protein [Burkholderiaceae bacterium]
MAARRLSWFLAGAACVAALVALNPSPERHRERIRAAVAERSLLAGLLKLGDVAAFVATYRSFGVASTMKAGERTVSVGAFGYVDVLELQGGK